MAMFQYFKRVDGQYPGSKLPDPQGALAQEVHICGKYRSCFTSASWWSEGEHERNVPENEFWKEGWNRKRAAKHGVLATVRYYASRLLNFSKRARCVPGSARDRISPRHAHKQCGRGVFGAVNSRNYFNEIFKNSNSRKFRPAKFLRYTVWVPCGYRTLKRDIWP